MAQTIPNLWPDTFKVDVQSPLAILRVQAEALGKVTRGLLEGAVETEEGQGVVQDRLVVVAPAYNGYRHTLIVAKHHPTLLYPVELRAEALAKRVRAENTPLTPVTGPTYRTEYPSAHTDDQMVHLVQQALASDQTKAVILSLIAKSNEAKYAPALQPPVAAPPASEPPTAQR